MFLLTALGALLGCTGTLDEESFVDAYAKENCKALRECDKAFFLDEYGDLSECREELEDSLEVVLEDKDCDFEPDEADRCLASFKDYRATCDLDDLETDDCADALVCGGIEPSTTDSTYYYGYTEY